MKHFATLALLSLLSTGALAAPKANAPTKNASPTKAKKALTTLNYCPMTGEKLPKKHIGAMTYKNYSIAFCCPGCPEEFKGLSAKEKDAKIAEIVAKQAKADAKPKTKA